MYWSQTSTKSEINYAVALLGLVDICCFEFARVLLWYSDEL